MSLNTLGAILTFAIDLEDALQHFYRQASALDGESPELFESYAHKSAKRRQRLVAIRQDNVTEMVLEPISGLVEAEYTLTYDVPSDVQSALREAIRLESRAERFYNEAGSKLNVTEARRAFQKLARENAERLTELRTTSITPQS